MLTRRELVQFVAAWPLLGRTVAPAFWDPNKRLLLDTRLVERTDGLHVTPGTVRKEARNPLFGEDKPWEVRIDNLYGNVLWDEEERIYKLWYNPFIVYERHNKTPRAERPRVDYMKLPKGQTEMGVCYATSRDGLVWDKPELGLVEFEGSTRNNLILRARPEPTHWVPHGSGIWKDLGDLDRARRYKLLFCKPHVYLCVSFSRDGIHWDEPVRIEGLNVRGDTHNNTFWAPSLEKFVGFTRRFGETRIVTRTESEDFLHWTEGVDVLRHPPGQPNRQTYAMIVFPYANVYLGLLMVLNRGEKMNREDPNDDTVDCELTWSPDTVRWERVCAGTPLIPRGPGGSQDWGCLYACAYPMLRDGVLRLYYGGNNGKHSDWRDGFLNLAYLRPDGFAGMEPATAGGRGSVILHPMECPSTALRVTADAKGGEVTVTALDASGKTIAQSEALRDDVTNASVRWKKGSLVRGRPLRLRFDLERAKLYSFRFA